MPLLSNLPPPPPQLDFPAMEQERQALVQGYAEMAKQMLAALSQKMDAFVQEGLAVKSASVSYQQGAKQPQLERRQKIIKVMLKAGVNPAAFEPGGSYEHTSDQALYAITKTLVTQHRSRGGTTP